MNILSRTVAANVVIFNIYDPLLFPRSKTHNHPNIPSFLQSHKLYNFHTTYSLKLQVSKTVAGFHSYLLLTRLPIAAKLYTTTIYPLQISIVTPSLLNWHKDEGSH